MKLKDLKAAAESKLGSVHADVLTYVNALEAKAGTNKYVLIGAGVVVLVILVAVFRHKF